MNAALSAENARQSTKIKDLEVALAAANAFSPVAAAAAPYHYAPPPGFPTPATQYHSPPAPAPPAPAPPAPAPAPAAGANTGHVLNTQGQSCPVRRGTGGQKGGSPNKWYFVTQQKCKYCNREKVWHVPENCTKGPIQQRRAAEALQKKAAEDQQKAHAMLANIQE